MNYRQFMSWVQKQGKRGRIFFRVRDVASILRITPNHAATDLHRCWKMGLLNRKKVIDDDKGGIFYSYWLSARGRKFLPGHSHDSRYDRFLLLKFIAKYGDRDNKEYAQVVLIPRILKDISYYHKDKEIGKDISSMLDKKKFDDKVRILRKVIPIYL
ncbi:MAG: hypothetical protein KAU24_03165 [Candidatus Aenigmarchaeota archaeon]|nr:hypothetical protein [Candidatus Aenigmarchaeota archaeon]